MNLLKIVMKEKIKAEDKIIRITMLNIKEVKDFSFEKHKGQIRPNKSKEPKIIHISEVANWVKKAGGSDIEIAAAYLHDTIEDTNTTLEEIIASFGNEVASLVSQLTDPIEFVNMEINMRKQLQAKKIKHCDSKTKLVKIADQISNVYSVYRDPPTDWNNEICLDYIIGAKKIVDACNGCNQYLENEFDKIYKLATKKYK